MKVFLLVSILFSSVVSFAKNSVACPVLQGLYLCSLNNGTESKLKILEVRGGPLSDPGDVYYNFIALNQVSDVTNIIYSADNIPTNGGTLTACIADPGFHESIISSQTIEIDRRSLPEQVIYRRYDRVTPDNVNKNIFYFTKEVINNRKNERSWMSAICKKYDDVK